jgi:hypothetical protein
VKQAETAVMNRDAAHEQKMPDKAVQKAETRAKQCLKEVETLHSQYQKSVTTLQEAQATHDVTVVDLLQQFEKLERTRLRVFLDQLERFAGQHDGLNANLESVAASLHQQTKAVNISADIQEFIRANASGKAPTPHVEYIPCQSKIIDHAMDLKPSNAGTQPVNAGFVANTSPLANNHAPNHNAAAAGGSSSTTYAEVPITPAAASAAGTGETAVALYDFDQNEPDDLAFKAGEIIKLLASPETEDWWQGEKDGRIGIFPKAYVQKGGAAGTVGAPGSAPGSSQQTVQVAAPVASTATSFSVPPPTAAAAPVVQSSVASTPAAAAPKSSNPFGDDSDAFGGGAATSASPAAQPGEAAAAAEVPKLMSATCAALFDFEGQDDDELTFKVGDSLVITGELNGWSGDGRTGAIELVGCNEFDVLIFVFALCVSRICRYLGKIAGTEKIGIFPSNYVNLQA